MASSARSTGSVPIRVKRSLAILALGLALSLAACGGGDDEAADTGSSSSGGAGAGASTVAIEGFAFKPDSISVPAGTKVTWTNADSAAHTIQAENNLFPTSPNILGATTFEHAYDKAGTYPYKCGIHNYMTGTVVVT